MVGRGGCDAISRVQTVGNMVAANNSGAFAGGHCDDLRR